MTIKEYIKGGMEQRLERLVQIGAPNVMVEGVRKNIQNLKVNGDPSLLDIEIQSKEVKTGRGGKRYIVFNGEINFFPEARYGMFIAKA